MMTVTEIRNEIKAQNLDIDGVCEWLEQYGSDEDPIFWKGSETTPRALASVLAAYTPALDVRISFYGTSATGRLELRRNSNFARMLKDRIDMFAEREREEKKHKNPLLKTIKT